MVVIFISIYPVELEPVRDFGSEADFAPPQRGELPYSKVGVFFFINRVLHDQHHNFLESES
jgi:hypothetical protein